MATSAVGNPYVESSDLVANYPATSLALATRLDKYALNPFADAAARDTAIPSPVQGQLAQTLDDNKAWKYDESAWAPFSGAGAANFTDTATGTYTDGGIDYKYLTLTGTGSVTIDQAGFCDLLIVGGGGGGGTGYGGGGGAGAFVYAENAYLSAATHTVLIGAGGAARIALRVSDSPSADNGQSSVVADYISPGGGGGPAYSYYTAIGYFPRSGVSGGSGSGGAGGDTTGSGATAGTGGSGLVGFGGDGGTVTTSITYAAAGGGGAASGASGTGVSPTTNTNGGAGGAGASSAITGSAQLFCGGGGGSGSSTAGAGGSGGGGSGSTGATGGAASANTGSGGGGCNLYTASVAIGGNGGSGIVIIRVVV